MNLFPITVVVLKNSRTHTFAHLCQILYFSLSWHSKVTVSEGETWLYNFQSGNEMVNTDSWYTMFQMGCLLQIDAQGWRGG